MKRFFLTSILCLGSYVSAQEGSQVALKGVEPWFTGPLIAPLGKTVPYGEFAVRSYLYANANTGVYGQDSQVRSSAKNLYTLNAQFLLFFGLTPWCDINIIPQVVCHSISKQQCAYIGDLTVGLDFQLMAADITPYFPGIKLAIREVFPTGNFEWFRPKKLLTEQTGAGTFATQFDLVLYKEFLLSNRQFLSTTLSAQYTINTPVHVHGFHTYGGGFGANGMALPGNNFQAIASFEFALNQNWALALDSVYSYTESTQFYGNPGITFRGEFAEAGQLSSKQLSFAPAIEYNFSKNFGIIAGCWFSAWGENSTKFRSGVINFNVRL